MSKPAASRRSKKQRPGALGLTQFAEAKVSTYDKKARKEKERALNSKVVNKYRKLQARLGDDTGSRHGGTQPVPYQGTPQELPDERSALPSTSPSEAGNVVGKAVAGRDGHARRSKPAHQLQRIHAKTKKERVWHAARFLKASAIQSLQASQHKSNEATRQEEEELASRRAQALRKRKVHSVQMRKKTRSGQPVMKVRIGKMLEQLQADAT